jgi:hypothetical protein
LKKKEKVRTAKNNKKHVQIDNALKEITISSQEAARATELSNIVRSNGDLREPIHHKQKLRPWTRMRHKNSRAARDEQRTSSTGCGAGAEGSMGMCRRSGDQ